MKTCKIIRVTIWWQRNFFCEVSGHYLKNFNVGNKYSYLYFSNCLSWDNCSVSYPPSLISLDFFPIWAAATSPLFSFHPLVNSIFRSVPIHWCRISSWRKRVAISPFMSFFRRLFWNITVPSFIFCGISAIYMN